MNHQDTKAPSPEAQPEPWLEQFDRAIGTTSCAAGPPLDINAIRVNMDLLQQIFQRELLVSPAQHARLEAPTEISGVPVRVSRYLPDGFALLTHQGVLVKIFDFRSDEQREADQQIYGTPRAEASSAPPGEERVFDGEGEE